MNQEISKKADLIGMESSYRKQPVEGQENRPKSASRD